jgi:hypothetical protein
LEKTEWIALLDAITVTFTRPDITGVIADMADLDPILIPPLRNLHIVSGHEIAGFLPPLQPVAGATGSRGAHLRADPALDLADPDDRAVQATRWLCQIAADAGLIGMERLVQR